MYLRIIGDSFTENVFKEIEAITNYGALYIKKVKYCKEDKIVSLHIDRYKIEEMQNRLLKSITSYKYNKNIKIPTIITIRNVDECIIENNFDDPNMVVIQILFGLKVEDNDLYISSVEESRGQNSYILQLRVSEIDIEIRDQNEGRSTP